MISTISDAFTSVEELKSFFSSEAICIDHLQQIRWDTDIISPFDSSSKIYECKEGRFRCRNTGKYFNVKTNTVFHNTKVELQKWFVAIWMLSKNQKMTTGELSKELKVTPKTAWLMQKRVSKYIQSEDENAVVDTKPAQMQMTDWLAQLK